MKKVKILHIGMGPNRGGLESFTLNMQKNIDNKKFQFDYTNTFGKSLAYEKEVKELGSKIYSLCPRKKNPIKSFNELKKIIVEGEYDYVHYHCMHYCWFDPIIITTKYTNASMIVHSHLTGFNKNSSKKEILLDKIGRLATKKCNFLKLACGKNAGKWLFGKKKYTVIPNGIDFDVFKYDVKKRKNVRQIYGFEENDIVIGHVGNYSYQKNYPKLISIFKELHGIDSRYKLLLVGNDKKPAAIEIKKLVEEKGLKDKVVFAGLIDNNINIYSGCDLYIFPSFYEGLNISLIEAQCSGLMCFASDTLDPDTCVGGKYYNINIFNDSKKIANQINSKVKKEKYDRKKITIKEEYSIKNAAKVLEKFYLDNIKNDRE